MRRAAVAAVLVALFSAPAFAQVEDIDTDADGLVSFEEMSVAYPDMGQETFDEVDTSDDGFVDEAEMAAAIEGGLVTPMEG